MKIGFDAKRYFHNATGLGNYSRDVVRILHEYTHIDDFVLYNTKPSEKYAKKIPKRASIRYPQQWFWKHFSSIWRLGIVTRQIQKDGIDIFHGLSGETPAYLKPNNIQSVVTIHDLIFLSHPHYYSIFDRFIYKLKFQHAVDNADKIIAISEQTKRDLITYLKADQKKIEVVYQGCNAAYKKEYSEEEKANVKSAYKLPEEFVLNVGTLQERKNALTIVKAVKTTGHHLVLIGGEKSYAKKIRKYIGDHQMTQQVIFLSNVPVEELAIIYQLATVFCYPSICEGFGIPIIEALYSKTPVITSKGSCFHESGGPSSIYIKPKDHVDLSLRINQLFNDANLRSTIAKEGYSFVQKFNDQNVAEALFKVYNSLQIEPKNEQVKLTALMITFNEIEHIEAVIQNLSFADEIIIVDSYSTDGTVEVIQKYPQVQFIQREFKNFTDQKAFALEQANNDWVLFMDADERVTPKLEKEIVSVISQSNLGYVAYYFYRRFMFKNQILRFSGWQTDKNYRLFRKSKVKFSPERIVHETLVVNGESSILNNKLLHYSYKNFEDYKGKMLKYGRMKAIEEAEKGKKFSFIASVFRPAYKFLNHFILRLGFLDGKKGLIISYLNALGVKSRFDELKRIQDKSS